MNARLDKPSSIFIWHMPVDLGIAQKLARRLQAYGLEVYLSGEENPNDGQAFNPADWQLVGSDSVIFLLSEDAAPNPQLRNAAEKVLRGKDALLIPMIIDDNAAKNLPLVLRFIQPLEFYGDYQDTADKILEEVQRKNQGLPSKLRSSGRVWGKPFRWLIEHFRRYLTLPPLTFCWQITVENLIVSLVVSGLVYLIWQPAPRTNLENLSAGTFLWTVVILGPVIETVLLQMIPVFLARILGLQIFGQLFFSIVPFAMLHFSRSFSAGIGAGIIGGFYSALTYVHWYQKSFWTAFWVTSFSHALYNFALFAMLIGEY